MSAHVCPVGQVVIGTHVQMDGCVLLTSVVRCACYAVPAVATSCCLVGEDPTATQDTCEMGLLVVLAGLVLAADM